MTKMERFTGLKGKQPFQKISLLARAKRIESRIKRGLIKKSEVSLAKAYANHLRWFAKNLTRYKLNQAKRRKAA